MIPGLYHVIAGDVNFRAGPTTDADVLGQLQNGQHLDVSASSPDGAWLQGSAQVFDADVTGWMAARFLVADDATPGTDSGGGDTALSVTLARLQKLAPGADQAILAGIAAAFDGLAAEYDITTTLRICHFLAQVAHESAGFRTLNEYGGPSYFAKYDGRKDLGNTQPGDGNRFHGRGLLQLTGRSNYARYGAILGVDLVGNPELAARPDISLRIAMEYWKARHLNDLADADDCKGITRRVNGGYNGLSQREAFLKKCMTIWGA